MRNRPKFERGVFVAILVLLSVGLAWAVLGKKTLPSPLWGALAGWMGTLAGGLMAFMISRLYLQVLPQRARRGSLSGLAFWGAIMLAFSIVGGRAILLGVIPAGAAYFWGEEATQNAIVLKSSPDKRRKGCSGSVELRTATGEIELCDISRDFLENLTRGDTVVITGRGTRLGQTIETLRVLKK